MKYRMIKVHKLSFIILLLLLLTVHGYGIKEKGLILGVEANFGFVEATYESVGATKSTKDTTFIYGGSIIGEWGFSEYLALGFGLGFKHFSLQATDTVVSSKYTSEFTSNIIDIFCSIRPKPLLAKTLPLTFFFGLGVSFRIPLTSNREVEPGSSSDNSNIFGFGMGIVAELGFRYYVSANIALQGMFRGNFGIIDMDKSPDKLSPHFFEFGVGILYKLF